jgi:hypothetical protein
MLAHARFPPNRLEVFFTQNGVAIENVREEVRQGQSLIRVDYTCRYQAPDGSGEVISRGAMWFDPSNHWALKEVDLTAKGGRYGSAKHHYVLTFGEAMDGFKLPLQLDRSYRTGDDPTRGTLMTVVKYEGYQRRDLPEREFAVSAYGLPEIDPALARTNPLWYWCFGLAALACGGVFFFRWYGRRRTAAVER